MSESCWNEIPRSRKYSSIHFPRLLLLLRGLGAWPFELHLTRSRCSRSARQFEEEGEPGVRRGNKKHNFSIENGLYGRRRRSRRKKSRRCYVTRIYIYPSSYIGKPLDRNCIKIYDLQNIAGSTCVFPARKLGFLREWKISYKSLASVWAKRDAMPPSEINIGNNIR